MTKRTQDAAWLPAAVGGLVFGGLGRNVGDRIAWFALVTGPVFAGMWILMSSAMGRRRDRGPD